MCNRELSNETGDLLGDEFYCLKQQARVEEETA